MDFFKLIPTSGSEVFLTDIYGTYNKFLIGVLVITLIAFIANLQLNWLLNFNLKSLINKTPTPAEFHSFTQAPIMGGMPPIIAKNLTDMAMRRLRNYAINNIVLPAANPGARIILNNLGPTPQMPSINNALTRSSMNRGTILSPNFSTAQSLSNIQQIAASHNTSMENAARLIDRHIQEAVRTLWAMFILLAVNSLLIVYFLGCLLHINEFTNNRYRYLVWLFPSRTVAARPSQIIEIEEDEESSMSTATDVNYTTLEDMRARAESYWGTPSDETETSSSVEEDVSSSTLSEDETQSPTRSNTSEVGTQTDPIEENISSDELPASDNLSKVPKDNGPGSDSQQGGGGSSSAMTINNLTIEEPSYGPNYEQDWPEILEEIIRDLLGLIPELANLPFLVLIYWLAKFAFAFSDLYYFMWANAHLVAESFSNYNLSSIIDILKDGFNYCYEEGYMLLWSAFPTKLPPLPGRNPLSFIMVIMYLMHLYITFKLFANVQKLIYLTFKFLCYLILPSYPLFVIKHLFFFDKEVQHIWIPLLTLLNSPKRDTKFYDGIVAYYALRRFAMNLIIIHLIWALLEIILCCLFLFLINLNGVWA